MNATQAKLALETLGRTESYAYRLQELMFEFATHQLGPKEFGEKVEHLIDTAFAQGMEDLRAYERERTGRSA